jgi:hypothetical protein
VFRLVIIRTSQEKLSITLSCTDIYFFSKKLVIVNLPFSPDLRSAEWIKYTIPRHMISEDVRLILLSVITCQIRS